MKFLFVQKSGLPWHGIMSLAATLKDKSVDVDLILTDEEKRPLEYIKKFGPDFVGFPVITGEHAWIQPFAEEIKERLPKVKIVMGGPHATFYPETLSNKAWIIRGEAELLLADLLNHDGEPHTVGPADLLNDLDVLPAPDRSIYYKYSHLAKATTKQFLTGRGCPYNCSFCCNHLLRKMYKGHSWVRRRSPENVMREMMQVQYLYGFKTASFSDDVFTLNTKWLEEFLDYYRAELGLPFLCNTRYEQVNEEMLEILKNAGCYGLEMGVESGSEFIRREILTKGKGTNEQITNAGRLIKKFGLRLKTYNMIGLPHETLRDAFKTIELNTKMKPDFAACSFLIPYPRYKIAEYFDTTKLPNSIYKPLDGTSKEIINLQTFFFIATKFPRLTPIIKLLIRLPPNKLFRLLASVFYGLFMSKVHRLTLRDMWRYARHIDPFRI